MKLTTKGRYAVTAMLDIVLYGNDQPVCLSDIANRQEISLAYLEQLFSKLRKRELVCSVRGPSGGYRLSKDAKDLSVAEIIIAVDEVFDARGCAGNQDCNEGLTCLTHHLWDDLTAQISQFLGGISLKDLSERKDVQCLHTQQAAMHAERGIETQHIKLV